MAFFQTFAYSLGWTSLHSEQLAPQYVTVLEMKGMSSVLRELQYCWKCGSASSLAGAASPVIVTFFSTKLFLKLYNHPLLQLLLSGFSRVLLCATP